VGGYDHVRLLSASSKRKAALTARIPSMCSAFATRTAGVLHLAPRLPTLAGIDNSFWVSIALAFIDFTEDQEVSMQGHIMWD